MEEAAVIGIHILFAAGVYVINVISWREYQINCRVCQKEQKSSICTCHWSLTQYYSAV